MARLINGTGIHKDVVRRSTFFTELCIAATENLSSKDPAQYRRRLLDKCNREHLTFLDREIFGSNKPKIIFILGSSLWREGFLWLAKHPGDIDLPHFPKRSDSEPNVNRLVEIHHDNSRIKIFVITHPSAAISRDHMREISDTIEAFVAGIPGSKATV